MRSIQGRRQGIGFPLDSKMVRRDNESLVRSSLAKKSDRPIVIEAFRVACGLSKLCRQRRKARAHEYEGQRPVCLAEFVDRGVDRNELIAGRLLKLVNENEDSGPEVAGRFSEDFEQ